jgi:PAS domain S-box-containing protein
MSTEEPKGTKGPADFRRGPSSSPRLRSAAVFLLAAATLCTAFLLIRRLEHSRARLEFVRTASQQAAALSTEIQSYLGKLHAISAFFRASEYVTRAEFNEFARPLHDRSRGLRAFDWVPRVTDAERTDYENRVRREIPGFRITEITPEGRLQVAGRREEYYPIDYIEPVFPEDESIRGFDLGSHPVASVPLFKARDTGRSATVGPTNLIVDPIDSSGYLILLPRYENGLSPSSVQARRDAFAGVIVAVFQLNVVLHEVLERFPAVDVNVEIRDGENVVAMYREVPPELDPSSTYDSSHRDTGRPLVESIRIGDRKLEVYLHPTAQFMARHTSPLPWIVLAGGGIFLLSLLFYLVRLQGEINKRQESQIALRESERRYRILVEYAPEAILVLDAETGRFVDANENAVKLFKLSRERLFQRGPADLSPPLQPDGRESETVAKAAISEALAGATPTLPWMHRDSSGKDIPCEVRLVSLPPSDKALIRGSITDLTERRQAELRELMMARELDHRVKNNLAEVLALAEQTGVSASSFEEFRKTFADRLRAMARAHEALAAHRWQGVPFLEVLDLTLGAYGGHSEDRIMKHGSDVMLDPSASSALVMTLHELAANAAKYGALATPTGRVELRWRRDEDGNFEILWRETGGPPATPPTTTGFGTRLLHGVVTHQLGGTVKMEYEPQGLRCEIRLPSDHLQSPPSAA